MITQEEFENYDISKFNGQELKEFIHKFIQEHPDVMKLDLTHWNVSNIRDMSWMFSRCELLESTDDSN